MARCRSSTLRHQPGSHLRSDIFAGRLAVNARQRLHRCEGGRRRQRWPGAAGLFRQFDRQQHGAQVLSANLNAVEATGVTAHSNKHHHAHRHGCLAPSSRSRAVSVNTIESAPTPAGADFLDPRTAAPRGPPSSINQDSDFRLKRNRARPNGDDPGDRCRIDQRPPARSARASSADRRPVDVGRHPQSHCRRRRAREPRSTQPECRYLDRHP